MLSLNRGIYVDYRGAIRRCVSWHCDHGMEISYALKVYKIARIVGGVSARALVGHIPRADIVCGGFEMIWVVVI